MLTTYPKELEAYSNKNVDRVVSDLLPLLFQAMRPRQWVKNLIVFIPLIFAAKLSEFSPLLATAIYAFAFCLGSSACYLVNDVLDRQEDLFHPVKSKRAIASGKISVKMALVAAGFLALIALAVSAVLRPSLALMMLFYMALVLLYGKVLKHEPVLDVMAVAAGFVIRALGGCLVAGVAVSSWFLLCTSLGALFLAVEKRRHELSALKDFAGNHRRVLLAYSPALLNKIEGLVVSTLFICYIFYCFLSYHGQWMVITVPFVFYGVVRYELLAAKGILTGSPEEVLLKDGPIQATLALWLLSVIGVVYGFIPLYSQQILRLLDTLAFVRCHF
jgi:4-hydroxybenzoate polyprenyltransferase